MRNAELDSWVRGWLDKSQQYWGFVRPKLESERKAESLVEADRDLIVRYEAALRGGCRPTKAETMAYLQAQAREVERLGSASGKSAEERYILAMGRLPGLAAELKALEAEAGFEARREGLVEGMRERRLQDMEGDLEAVKADPSANLATLWTDAAPAWAVRLMTKAERDAVSRFCVEAARWNGPNYRNLAAEARACILAVAIRTAVEQGGEPTAAQVERLRSVLGQVPPNRLPAILESAHTRPVGALLSDQATEPGIAAELAWSELELLRLGRG